MTRLTATAYGLSSSGLEGPDWRRDGLCKDDPDRWSDIPASIGGNQQAAIVSHLCSAHCKAYKPCREDAIRQDLDLGRGIVQGGMRVQGKASNERLATVAPAGHGKHCPPGTWQPNNSRRILSGAKHGRPSTYRRGCQCQPCTTAWAEYRQAQRRELALAGAR